MNTSIYSGTYKWRKQKTPLHYPSFCSCFLDNTQEEKEEEKKPLKPIGILKKTRDKSYSLDDLQTKKRVFFSKEFTLFMVPRSTQ